MFRDLPKYAETTSNSYWLTRTPTHWAVRPGLAVLKENRRKNTGLIETQVLSLSYGQVVVKPIGKQHGLVPDSYEGYQVLEPGDIVIRPTDLQNDQTSVRVGRAKDHGIITSAYIGLRPVGDWDGAYAHQYLTTIDSTKRIYGMGSGLRQQLGWADLKRMPCLVPPDEEQAAIVKYLTHANARIDNAIAAKRRLIALLDEQREKVRADLFLGLPGSAARLKDIATIQTGLTLGKDYGAQELTSYPYLRVANVQMGRVDASTIAHVAVPEREAVRSTLRAGDVLMTEGGDIDKLGRGVVWDGQIEPCLHQNHVFAVRCKDVILPEFLASWLSGPVAREYFYVTAKKTTNLASTNSTTLGKLPIVLPSLEDQARILRDVEDRTASMDVTIGKSEREILLLREFRTRLVADVVTGQVDVRAIAASLPDTPEQDADLGSLLDDDLEDVSGEGEE